MAGGVKSGEEEDGYEHSGDGGGPVWGGLSDEVVKTKDGKLTLLVWLNAVTNILEKACQV